MDIYQCMTCGKQWVHGGQHVTYVQVAQHAEETRFSNEGMHYVLIGERTWLNELRRRYLAGEVLVKPNDHSNGL